MNRVRSGTLLAVGFAVGLAGGMLRPSPAGAQDPEGEAGAEKSQGRTGSLVVANKNGNTADIIDLASGKIVATLPTGRNPHELVVSSDGRTAVITNYGEPGDGTLTVIDVAAMKVARTIVVGGYRRLHGIAFMPGDEVVAVTSERDSAVVLVKLADGKVEKAIPTLSAGSHMLAIPGDGAAIFTGDMGSGTASLLDVASGKRTRAFSVPSVPEAVSVSRDGKRVWVGSNREGSVSVVDVASGKVEKAFEGFGWPYRILLVPARDLVVIPDLRKNQVRFGRISNFEERKTLEVPGGPQGVAVTPDKGTLFLSVNGRDEIAVIDLASFEIVRRIAAGDGPDGIGWSPLVPDQEGRR